MLSLRPDDEEAAVRVVVMQFMTLDGVTQGPGAPDEDTSDGFARGGWLVGGVDGWGHLGGIGIAHGSPPARSRSSQRGSVASSQ